MFTIALRILRYGVKNFTRNGWLSTTTVIVTTISLLVSIWLMLFNVVTRTAIASVQDKIDISLYFKSSTSEDDILAIKEALEKLPDVKSVEYVSRDKALEQFRAAHKDDPTIVQALAELDENPLEAYLNIKAKDPSRYAAINEYLRTPNIALLVSSATYTQSKPVIDRLNAIIRRVNSGGLAVTIIMALIAGLVVFNTIRLAIYSSRDEIGIMRVVGASNILVRGPFVVEGILNGIIAAVLSVLVTAPIVFWVSPYFRTFIPELNLFAYFTSNIFTLLLYQLFFGAFIGGLSSFVAVRRYLRN